MVEQAVATAQFQNMTYECRAKNGCRFLNMRAGGATMTDQTTADLAGAYRVQESSVCGPA